MPDIVISISNIESKLFQAFRIDVSEWVENAIRNKANALADKVIRKLTTVNPANLSKQDKTDLLISLNSQELIETGSMNPPINVPY